MIREIFLIDRSVLQFHYSSKVETSDDKAVLSSGFFSAIQDFSAHARSDVLDSFSTENEYFLYLRFPETEKILVGVFDRKAPEPFAREAMEKIKTILLAVKMPDVDGMQLAPEKKENIREQISGINIQLFSDERLSTIVIDLLKDRSDIPLAFLVDSSTNSLIASFSRPKPLFKDSQVREFLLVHSTLEKTLENLGMSPNYSYFIVESEDYAVVACNGGRLLSVASGAMKIPIENVYEAATSMCYADVFDSVIENSVSGDLIGDVVFQDGKAINRSGKEIPVKAQIFISTLAKNVESLFRSLTRRPFVDFSVRITGEPSSVVTLTQHESELEVKILQY